MHGLAVNLTIGKNILTVVAVILTVREDIYQYQ